MLHLVIINYVALLKMMVNSSVPQEEHLRLIIHVLALGI